MGMQTVSSAPTPSVSKPKSGRTISALVMVVIAGLLFPLAVLGFWANHAVLDEDRYLAAVAPLATDPAVQDAVAATLKARVAKTVDFEKLASQVLPEGLAGLGAGLSGVAQQLADSAITSFVRSDAFVTAWAKINVQAHQSLMNSLRGDQSGAISTSGDQVILDTSVVVQEAWKQLSASVPVLSNLPVPTGLGEQIVLLDASEVSRARAATTVLDAVGSWLLVVVIVAFLAAIALAVRRGLVLAVLGVVLIVDAGILVLVVSAAQADITRKLAETTWVSFGGAYWQAISGGLATATALTAIIGVVLAVAGGLMMMIGRTTTAAAPS